MAANTFNARISNYKSCRKWWIERIKSCKMLYMITDSNLLDILTIFSRFPKIEFACHKNIYMIHIVGEHIPHFIRCVNEGFNPNTLDGNKDTVFDRSIKLGYGIAHVYDLSAYGARPQKPFPKHKIIYGHYARIFIELGMIAPDTNICGYGSVMKYTIMSYNACEIYNLLLLGGDPYIRPFGKNAFEYLYPQYNKRYNETLLEVGMVFSTYLIRQEAQNVDWSGALNLLYQFV
jgi:hypothetical protein